MEHALRTDDAVGVDHDPGLQGGSIANHAIFADIGKRVNGNVLANSRRGSDVGLRVDTSPPWCNISTKVGTNLDKCIQWIIHFNQREIWSDALGSHSEVWADKCS